MREYILINYFDVWYNQEEGWWVNDQCQEGDPITITDDATDEDIINYLYNIKFFNTNDMSKFRVDQSSETIEIYDAEDDRPLCGLIPTY